MFFGLWRRSAALSAPTTNRFVPRLEAVEDRLAPSTVSGFYGGGVVSYTIQLAAGSTISANVKATNPGAPNNQQFDPIVGLFSPSGTLLTSNDDAGTGSHWAAKVTYTVPTAGTYRLSITHYSDFDVVGTPTQSDPHPGLDTGAFIMDVTVTGGQRHWRAKDGTVHIPPELEARLDQIADAYYQQTHKILVITDGKREPREQAQAMYNKMHGDTNGVAKIRQLYRDKTLVNQIIAAYRNNVGRQAKIDAMTATIQTQVNNGQYISKHLRSDGVDVRSRDLTAAQKQAFKSAAAAAGGFVIREGGSQPHFHVQF